MTKPYKFCQSCNMPMKHDPTGGGLEADGSKSTMYCSYCYADGKFTMDCTAGEMQTFCKQQMRKMGFPRPLAWLFTRGIPKLERWKNVAEE